MRGGFELLAAHRTVFEDGLPVAPWLVTGVAADSGSTTFITAGIGAASGIAGSRTERDTTLLTGHRADFTMFVAVAFLTRLNGLLGSTSLGAAQGWLRARSRLELCSTHCTRASWHTWVDANFRGVMFAVFRLSEQLQIDQTVVSPVVIVVMNVVIRRHRPVGSSPHRVVEEVSSGVVVVAESSIAVEAVAVEFEPCGRSGDWVIVHPISISPTLTCRASRQPFSLTAIR